MPLFALALADVRGWGGRAGRCVASAAVLLTGPLAHANPLNLPGWDLIWHDEFDGPSVNTADWEVLNRQNSFNNEKQYYLDDQVTLDNGHLVLTATNQPIANKQYRSGLVDSKTQWSYGRFEARIDLPTSQGMWPAFWLLPDTAEVPWPSGGEIDIMENRGSQPNLVSSAYHWGDDFFDRQFIYDEYTATQPNGQPVNFHAGFHDYAVEWEPGILRFSVDGNVYQTITGSQAEIFDTPKSIILNLAVGGDFGGDPNASTIWPQEMRVDYVRVWQRPEGYEPPVAPPGLVNPSFDDNNGSLAGWTVFGNRIGNVQDNAQYALAGSHALKIYGQFNDEFGSNVSGVAQGIVVTEGATVTAAASAFTPSNDTIANSDNELVMKIEFYSTFDAERNSGDFLGESILTLLDGNSAENLWQAASLSAVAPQGAVEARLVFAFTQVGFRNGAVWIDNASLTAALVQLAGDYNDSGSVEQGDLDLVLNNWGRSAGPTAPAGWINTTGLAGFVDQNELDAVLNNWGSASAPNFSANPNAVPEPGLLGLLGVALAGMLHRRR